MEFNNEESRTSEVEGAIDNNPLTVTPDALLIEVIALMNQHQANNKILGSKHHVLFGTQRKQSSCVLVLQERQLVGIFTERDIVRLTASGTNLQGLTVGEVMSKSVITLARGDLNDIFAALFIFRRYKIRHLPIVNSSNELIGIVTPESIRSVINPAHILKLMKVGDVMTDKVIHAPTNASILSLAQVMAEYKTSCVVITNEEHNLQTLEINHIPVGIITERDIVKFQLRQLNIAEVKAQEVMSTPLFLLHPNDSLWTANLEMQKRNVRRLVVSWDGAKGLGIITQSSLLRVLDPVETYRVTQVLEGRF
jgi:CBS domain-containing protein